MEGQQFTLRRQSGGSTRQFGKNAKISSKASSKRSNKSMNPWMQEHVQALKASYQIGVCLAWFLLRPEYNWLWINPRLKNARSGKQIYGPTAVNPQIHSSAKVVQRYRVRSRSRMVHYEKSKTDSTCTTSTDSTIPSIRFLLLVMKKGIWSSFRSKCKSPCIDSQFHICLKFSVFRFYTAEFAVCQLIL